MKKIIALFTVLVLLVMIPLTAQADFKKTKVAVLDFQLQGEGYETQDMGSIVAEWFITALVREGRFDVVERAMLNKILSEQQMGVSGIVDDSSASQLGKVLGVKIIISGSVMKLQDVVEVNARIIDVETASIIAAESVKSTASTNLQSLIVEMSDKIIKNFPLEGYVVARDGDSLTIDLGKRTGVRSGMEFVVFKEGKVLKHPKTGEVLDVEMIQTGQLRITSVSKKIASANIIAETTELPINVGDMVKSISGPLTPMKDERNVPYATKKSQKSSPAEVLPDSADYIQKLQSQNLRDKGWAARNIIAHKVTDPAVFDVLEEVLLAMYNAKPTGRDYADIVAWMVKALGSPLLPQYKETLVKIGKDAKDRKVRKYARSVLHGYRR
ncbi:MAG: hypothetical protein KKB30_02790 [Proteobacteria bacterium]|nr:hypothetical protein [Pseudomonadota bacterium]MBU1716731.1 hypothetical protein [Pseudomonadota bacterium]